MVKETRLKIILERDRISQGKHSREGQVEASSYTGCKGHILSGWEMNGLNGKQGERVKGTEEAVWEMVTCRTIIILDRKYESCVMEKAQWKQEACYTNHSTDALRDLLCVSNGLWCLHVCLWLTCRVIYIQSTTEKRMEQCLIHCRIKNIRTISLRAKRALRWTWKRVV